MSRTAKTLEDKRKLEQEKLNGCLMELLKEEDNRYCADCDAKGPRWASWNLGVFLCIRCAGIHRNLGVHVSKVKSINLDSWTAEQVQSVRVMGNCKARAVYEANLPEHFRRPHSDSSMEAFIRAKYDQKRYIMKDWVKPKVNVEDLSIWEELQDIARGGTGSKRLAGVSSSMKPVKSAPQLSKNQPSKLSPGAAAPPPAQPPTPSAINDLVDLAPVAPDSWNKQRPVSSGGAIDDLLGLNAQNVAEQPSLVGSHTCFAVKQEEEEEETTSAESNPVFLEGVQAVSNGEMTGSNLNQQLLFGQNEGEKKTKTDIMALYGSGRSQTSGGGMGLGGFYQTGLGGFDPHSGNPNFHGHPMNQQQIQYPPGMQMGGYYCAGPFQGQQQTVAGPYFRGYQPNFTSSGYTGFPGGSPAQYTVGMMGQQQISSPVAGGYGVQSVQNQFATMGFQQPARATGNTLATNLWQ